MARSSGGGLVGRLLAGFRGRGDGGQTAGRGDERAPADASVRLEAARKRLKNEIPRPEDPGGTAPAADSGSPAP